MKKPTKSKLRLAQEANWKVYRLRGVYATLEAMYLDGHISKRAFVDCVDALLAAKESVAPNNRRGYDRKVAWHETPIAPYRLITQAPARLR